MNAKSLRTIIRALKGRSLKTVAAAEPDAIAWHLVGSVPHQGFTRRFPVRTGIPTFHSFRVQKGAVKGTALVGHSPTEGAHISRIASTTRDAMGYPVPLDLGVKGYRQLFRGIRSALGVPPGTPVRFTRTRNIFNLARKRPITRTDSSVRLR